MSLLLSQLGYKHLLQLQDSISVGDICTPIITTGTLNASASDIVSLQDNLSLALKRPQAPAKPTKIVKEDNKKIKHLNKLLQDDNDILLILSEYIKQEEWV